MILCATSTSRDSDGLVILKASLHLLQMTVAHIKVEMQKTLQWLVPMAENTVK